MRITSPNLRICPAKSTKTLKIYKNNRQTEPRRCLLKLGLRRAINLPPLLCELFYAILGVILGIQILLYVK